MTDAKNSGVNIVASAWATWNIQKSFLGNDFVAKSQLRVIVINIDIPIKIRDPIKCTVQNTSKLWLGYSVM